MRRTFALVLLLACSLAPAAARQQSRAPAPVVLPLYDVHERSILELQEAQVEGRITSRALVESNLARIRAYDQDGPTLNAIVTLNPNALADA